MKFFLSFCKGLLTFLLLSSTTLVEAQNGCTDPQALNYDVAANQNDGSCIYPVTNYSLTNLAILNGEVVRVLLLFYLS